MSLLLLFALFLGVEWNIQVFQRLWPQICVVTFHGNSLRSRHALHGGLEASFCQCG